MTGLDGQTHQVPRFTQTTTLAPDQQKLYDQQTQLGTSLNNLALSQTQRLADHLGKPIDFSGLPNISNDFGAERRVSSGRCSIGSRLRTGSRLQRAENRLTNMGFQRGYGGLAKCHGRLQSSASTIRSLRSRAGPE